MVDCRVDLVARGKYIDQVQIHASVAGRLVFSALGSTAAYRPGGVSGTGPTMPKVAPPPDDDESAAAAAAERTRGWSSFSDLGHHRVSQFVEAQRLDDSDDGDPGHMIMWGRIVGERETSAAKLGFLADMVPVAVC